VTIMTFSRWTESFIVRSYLCIGTRDPRATDHALILAQRKSGEKHDWKATQPIQRRIVLTSNAVDLASEMFAGTTEIEVSLDGAMVHSTALHTVEVNINGQSGVYAVFTNPLTNL
jgi:hypothetical protein